MNTFRPAFVVGVGVTDFVKPGSREWDYPDMARESIEAALSDAGIGLKEVDRAFAAYCYGESTAGQRALYGVGMTGIPVVNVNNACATGSSALFLAREAVRAGLAECVLAFGFEKMATGSLGASYADRAFPIDTHIAAITDLRGTWEPSPPSPQLFGAAGREHMERYGSTPEHFAAVASKNHLHSTRNPRAQFQKPFSVDEVLASPPVYEPLTRLQCSPTSDGSAAALVASADFVESHGLGSRAVEIAGQTLVTDRAETFTTRSAIDVIGADMTRRAAAEALGEAGVAITDVQVIELHDCFSTNELITYEGLGLANPGHGHELVEAEATTYGGTWVVNPSGGLISKGHPLGATGLAQCHELVSQLRGTADERQADGARIALQHNLGLGGACVVTVYRMGERR